MLNEKIMEFLYRIQNSITIEKNLIYAMAGNYASTCSYCSGECSGDCKGDCLGGCSGNCEGSCSGGCSGNCSGSCENGCEYDKD
jgi:hypothetical protein